ncbi:MAG: SMC-Scp complex subunit ScpB [Armatimonadota bacterium]|nr:SMC-Scp complex subunit ScpB [Armatimonadota bacterium]
MDFKDNEFGVENIKPAVECLLFVSTDPVTIKEMAVALQLEGQEAQVEMVVQELRQDLALRSGLQIARVAGGFQMCTRQEYSECVSQLLAPNRHKLSRAALETLAVVAYRQPVTQPEIEAVRGVNVDGVMKTLLDHGLVREVGRKQSVGRPILYATTREFLQRFGLNDLSDLPDVDEFGSNEEAIQQSLFEEESRPQIQDDSTPDSLRDAFPDAEPSEVSAI